MDWPVLRWLCVLAVMVCAGVARAGEAAAFVIHRDQVVGPVFAGFGAQMNPYLYAKPNWGDVNEENVKDLERKVRQLRPQFVRMFLLPGWWKDFADGVNRKPVRGTDESFIRTARLAQLAGATITLTMWWGDRNQPVEVAKQTARVLERIVREDHIDAVKSINLLNEPNLGRKREQWSLENYDTLYRTLDAELKRLGLRDRLQIIVGDLVHEHQDEWMQNINDHLAGIVDGVSIHAYWDYDDTEKLVRRLAESRRMIASMAAIAAKPLYVTEFGVRGIRNGNNKEEPWYYKDGRPIARVNLQALEIGWFMIEAINRGYAGTCQWDLYDCWYDRLMHYGVIDDVYRGWALKPAYFVLKMFTHTAGPGWRAVAVSGKGQDLQAAAMRGPRGELTAYVMNVGAQAAKLELSGFGRGSKLSAVVWNGEGGGHLATTHASADEAGKVTVMAPPQAIVAVTTEDVSP